ncbi:MAG TPA: serine hydrolase, partial [Rhodocyclaceae bacterium]|nr:serine hydrolase [Rhodocyclaceae bacterium]
MLKQRAAASALCLAALAMPALAEQKCTIQPPAREAAPKTPWIGKGNWLAPENLRYGLGNLPRFMPAVKLSPREPATPLPRAGQPLDLQRLTASDPIDGTERSLAFLLDTRLHADGVLVLRDGAVLVEDYRHGLSSVEPRLIGSATRPVVAMLAAISTAKGKLRLEHALSRHLPDLANVAELRKISLHRLLSRPDAFHWEETDLQAWRHAAGWDSEQAGESLRAWVKAAPWRLASGDQPGVPDGPEGQLVMWAVERAWKQPLPAVFCDRLFVPAGAEHPAYWATSPEGDALADGLALSLPDFARLGNA